MLITDSVRVWREAGGDYRIEWQTSRPGTEVKIAPLSPVPEGFLQREDMTPQTALIAGLPVAQRHYFRLSDDHGNTVLAAERRLMMDGAPNFRDFGGYPAAQGRRVKWGHLFRSGDLCKLSDRDQVLLASLKLDLICDFRRAEEHLSEPGRLPAGRAPRLVSLPIVPGSNRAAIEQMKDDQHGADRMVAFMVSINRDFASTQADRFAQMFREILALEDARLLLHCAAGKDRTGFAAAMILLALGVPRPVVMRDYLLSAQYFEPARELGRVRVKYELEHLDEQAVLPMLEVRETYLAAALHLVDTEYGGLDAYLEEVLGLGPAELAELRLRYLE